MASIYKRDNSPFWWVKYRHHITGEARAESTRLKHSVGLETRKAWELVAELTRREKQSVGVLAAERWEQWVPTFLQVHCAMKPQTLIRYSAAWRTVLLYLRESLISSPRLLQREHCQRYLQWRSQENKSIGKYKAGHNTALIELKTLGLIMKEAVLRGYATTNPCRQMGFRKAPPKLKPVFTHEDIEFVRGKIALQEEPLRTFLANSFEIARYQGCRLSETYLNPMEDVDLANTLIVFHAKGGRTHVTRLHPKLVPLFTSLQAAGATETYAMRKGCSKAWGTFLHTIGLKDKKPNICFHSLRVTVATELAKADVHESKAMKFLGHASTTVHRSYQRLVADDLNEAIASIA